MTDRLEDIARNFAAARDEVAELRPRLTGAQRRVKDLRTQLAEEIVKQTRAGRRQVDISRATGYTAERVRQICRAAGVEPVE